MVCPGLPPTTPVIVGVGQRTNRAPRPEDVVDAVTLMEQALRSAATDAGSSRLLERLDRVAVAQGQWRWPDPARLLADAVGATGATSVLAMASGGTPQALVHDAALRISGGTSQAAAVCGGEWVHGRRVLRGLGLPLPVTPQAGAGPQEWFGANRAWESPLEVARGYTQPLEVFALVESAMRPRHAQTIETNRDQISTLMSGFSAVAAEHPNAWQPQAFAPAEIRDASSTNRMVAFPYTKRLCSNWDVDMASAVLVCSAGLADALGIERDRWVFPLAGSGCDDASFFSELDDLADVATWRITAEAALGQAGIDADDVAHFDLYSCFPAVVQIQAEALGIGLDRPLTVTGGMPYFGGPMANYVGHAIATMVDVLRERPGELGCCLGNGGYLAKLSAGLYGTEPPADGFRFDDRTAEVRGLPHRVAVGDYEGTAPVEGVTVLHDHGGPRRGLATAKVEPGGRALGWTQDPDLMGSMMTDEWVGATMRLDRDGCIQQVCLP